MNVTTTSAATVTRYSVSYPVGRRVRGRVRLVEGVDWDTNAHKDKPHQWREMLHYGQRGTGFVQCICGAFGVPYRKPA